MPIEDEPTVFEWAGGSDAFLRMTTLFYEKYVVRDPLLAPVFAHAGFDHPKHVALWLAEVFGGSREYSSEHGGYAAMLKHHLGKRLTEDMRARWVELLVKSANEVGLPNDAEFRSVFSAYVEWGSRIAVENSQLGAAPLPSMPMPHWDWHTSAGGPNSRAPVAIAASTDPAAVPLGDPVSYEAHIRPLVRPSDQRGMLWAFDLWSYQQVFDNADRIFARLHAGTMPPDGPWAPSSVDLFRRWIDGGRLP